MDQINNEFGFGASISTNHRADVQTMMLRQVLLEVPFAFGDLAALAGDHAGYHLGNVDQLDVHELNVMAIAWSNPFVSEKDVKKDVEQILPHERKRILTLRRQWYSACRAFGQLQILKDQQETRELDQCFPRPKSIQTAVDGLNYAASPANAATRSGGYIPSRFELAEMETLSNYVDLAKQNREHFPRHSWRTYLTAHHAAIRAARDFANGHGDDSQKRLRDAVLFEAYAQHFLHDSFSSGHIGSEYGSCLFFYVFCSPTKRMLEHTHNMLNKMGVRVTIRSPVPYENTKSSGQLIGKEWLAFGDDYLFIQEAHIHRTVLLLTAAYSVDEVIHAAEIVPSVEETDMELCAKWLGRFPVPENHVTRIDMECGELLSTDAGDSGLDLVKSPRLSSVPIFNAIRERSIDAHVPDLPLEGWKLLVTWGPAYGRVGRTDALGRETTNVNMAPAGTLELGYVRSTEYMPNYVGVGMLYVPGIRTSIYPLSFGWWFGPAHRFYWGGLRFNFGPRLQEGHTEENRGSGTATYGDFNAVWDMGLEIYPPFSFYVRTELASLVVRGIGQGAPNRVTTDSLFANGHGVISFGLMFDLAQVF